MAHPDSGQVPPSSACTPTSASTAEYSPASSVEGAARRCHDSDAAADHGAAGLVKRVALVGSSGGGAAAQGYERQTGMVTSQADIFRLPCGIFFPSFPF